MNTGRVISVIIPCYNEEESVHLIETVLVDTLRKNYVDFELIMVDDGSSDATLERLMEIARSHTPSRVVRHQYNQGLGAAIRSGIAASSGALTVTIDSDMTFHPRYIKDLLERFDVGDCDCVIGSPVLGGYSRQIPRYRVLLSSCANLLYWFALGQRISSVTPIFRLYTTSQIKNLQLHASGFEINAEILFKLLANKKRVVEIPAMLTVRQFGVSKLRFFRALKFHFGIVLKIVYWRLAGVS